MDIPETPEAPPTFPGYRVDRMIGTGGAGKVYAGVALDSGEPVAIKVFHAHKVNRPEFARRFDREVALSRTLDHPGVVRLLGHAASEDGQSFALVMELVTGETLRPALKRGAMEPRLALLLALQVVEILAYVHQKGVAHLDLKPENVLLVGGTTVRLMDFGISQATHGQLAREGGRTAMIAGTPHYMAPEQFAGATDLDHRADLFTTGVILHEMLTGERPAAGIIELGEALPLKFRQELEPVLAKLLAYDPKDRYQTAADVADKLKQLLRTLEGVYAAREAAARIVIAAPAKKEEPRAERDVSATRPRPTAKKPAVAPPREERKEAAKDALREIAKAMGEHLWIPFVLFVLVFLAVMYNLAAWAFNS